MAFRDQFDDEDDLPPLPEEVFLREDLRKAVLHMTPQELQFLVDTFYQLQEDRKRAYNQLRAASEHGEPNAALVWRAKVVYRQEMTVQGWLDIYTMDKRPGRWLRSIHGIGAVLAAGLLAYVDITRAPYASSLWSYAGLSGHVRWLGRKGAQALYSMVRAEFSARTPSDRLVPRLAEASGFPAATLERWARAYDTGAKITRAGFKQALLEVPAMTEDRVTALMDEAFSGPPAPEEQQAAEFWGDELAKRRGLTDAIRYVAQKIALEPEALLLQVRSYDPGGKLTGPNLQKALARCPWNRDFKLLMYKVAEYGIVRPSTSDKASLYSHVYRTQKIVLVNKNNAGGFAPMAQRTLATRTFEDKDVEAVYKSGKIPDGRVDRLARAYAAKLLLAHLHHVLWECHYGTPPPLPYAFAKEPGRHQHHILPPNWPCA